MFKAFQSSSNPNSSNSTSSLNKKKYLENSLCYSAIIGSYFHIGKSDSVMKYYRECRKLGLFPSYESSLMIADVFFNTQNYKNIYEKLLAENTTCPGVPETERLFFKCLLT